MTTFLCAAFASAALAAPVAGEAAPDATLAKKKRKSRHSLAIQSGMGTGADATTFGYCL